VDFITTLEVAVVELAQRHTHMDKVVGEVEVLAQTLVQALHQVERLTLAVEVEEELQVPLLLEATVVQVL
jgi:hypothetical protein